MSKDVNQHILHHQDVNLHSANSYKTVNIIIMLEYVKNLGVVTAYKYSECRSGPGCSKHC